MAFEEQFTETIEAGAPSIKYEGDIQQQQQIAQKLWENLPPEAQAQFGSFEQFFSSGAWKKVLQALQQQMEQQVPQQGPQQGLQPMAQQPQEGIGSMMPAPMAYGGIAGADGRRAYGIGSWFQKKIMDPIKKNPLKTAAAAYGAYSLGGGKYGIPGLGSGKGFELGNLNPLKYLNKGLDRDNPNEMKNLKTWGQALMNPNFLIPAASLVSGAFAKPDEPGYTGQGTGLNIADIGKLANISDPQVGQAAGLRFLPDVETRKFTPEEMIETYAGQAHGGRIGAQEGGLMDLGGMEKDYRNDGGLVPIGGEEKADDVPARLSRNEFVFTADAVRNAGGGDMDRGAEVMENVMKNLEGGGRISDESQGKGAGEMFEVSERLSEVV